MLDGWALGLAGGPERGIELGLCWDAGQGNFSSRILGEAFLGVDWHRAARGLDAGAEGSAVPARLFARGDCLWIYKNRPSLRSGRVWPGAAGAQMRRGRNGNRVG